MEEKMAAERDSGDNIEILIRARYPLVYVVSFEEGRVEHRLRSITEARRKQLFNWTVTNGLELPDGSRISELQDPVKVLEYILQSDANALFVLRDYRHYLTLHSHGKPPPHFVGHGNATHFLIRATKPS
jgi:hypothetical protein